MTKHALVASLLCLISVPSFAEDTEVPYQWDAPNEGTQLNLNRQTLPSGMGGIFVPSMTGAGDESEVFFVSGEMILKGTVGEHIAVPPGRYTVQVGSSDPSMAMGAPIRVELGKTTLVPVTWGGLRMDVVDRRGNAAEVPLEIIHVASGERVALSPEIGDEPRTHLLSPGLYRVQTPGTSTVLQPNFISVHVPKSGLVRLKVFVDSRGLIEGGGVVTAADMSPGLPSGVKGWRRSLVVGVDGSYSQVQAMPGSSDLTFGQGSMFLDGEATYSDAAHIFEVRGLLDEGLSLVQPGTGPALPLIKGRDTAKVDGLYTVLMNDGVGLYVGGAAETNMLPTYGVVTEDSTVVYFDPNGGSTSQAVSAGDTYRIAEAFAPSSARTGAGARVRLSTARDLELSVRGGVGSRHYWWGGSAIPLDDPDTPSIEHVRPDNIQRLGVEAGAQLAIRVTRFATYRTEVLAFEGIADLGDADRLFLSWENDLSVGLTRAISIHYRANLQQIREISLTPQLEQGVYVRASWNLL